MGTFTMGKITESLEHKRELLYSFLTLLFTSILYYYFAVAQPFKSENSVSGEPSLDKDQTHQTSSINADAAEVPVAQEPDPNNNGNPSVSSFNHEINNSTSEVNIIQLILQKKELPFEILFYIILVEVLKLIIVLAVYPAPHIFDQSVSSKFTMSNLRYSTGGLIASPSSGFQNNRGGANSGSRTVPGRLPSFRREKEHVPIHTAQGHKRIWQIWKGLCNYILGCLVCHVFVVLLGAPIMTDLKLTFQLSVILTTLLFAPLCLAVQPGRMLEELMKIKTWSLENNEMLWRAKWRFATTLFGAWAGAIVIPLDWDRPWQKWPIPCLASTTITFLLLNLVLTLHFFCAIFEIYRLIPSLVRNKIKKI